jgi:hypothetical protein
MRESAQTMQLLALSAQRAQFALHERQSVFAEKLLTV